MGVLYVIRGLTLGVAWGVGAIGGRVAVGRENNALAAPGAARVPRMISHRPNMLHDVLTTSHLHGRYWISATFGRCTVTCAFGLPRRESISMRLVFTQRTS